MTATTGRMPADRTATNPAIGTLRTAWLLATRKLRFHPEDNGRMLTTDDGVSCRVFRHVVVQSTEDAPQALFIVRFTPARMTVRQNIRFSRLPMLPIMGFRGFRSKFWCVDDSTGACEGVYEWQTRADAEAYATSIALHFMANRSIPGSVSYRILERTGDEPWPFTLSGSDGRLE